MVSSVTSVTSVFKLFRAVLERRYSRMSAYFRLNFRSKLHRVLLGRKGRITAQSKNGNLRRCTVVQSHSKLQLEDIEWQTAIIRRRPGDASFGAGARWSCSSS